MNGETILIYISIFLIFMVVGYVISHLIWGRIKKVKLKNTGEVLIEDGKDEIYITIYEKEGEYFYKKDVYERVETENKII